MEQHRAQSVLAYQRPSHLQFRASKFVQKIATRVLTFKKRDAHGNSPYMTSQDATKPYMSQPMLNLHAAGSSADGNESSRSGSPCTIPPESLLTRHAVSTGLVPGLHAGVVVGGRGVSIDLNSDHQRQSQDTQTPASPDATPVANGAPQITVSKVSPTPRLKHMKEVISGRTSIDTQSRQPRRSHEGNPPSATIPTPESADKPVSGLPTTSSTIPPATLPPSISRRATPPRLDSLPAQISAPPSSDVRVSDMQAASVPLRSSHPRAATANIPSSFARTPSGAARLSPSVVTSYRTPPLLLRLPALPPPTPSPPEDAVGRRARSEALRGVMPQLSLQGGSHENDNDGDDSSSGSDEDGDEEDDETEREQASSSTDSFHSALQSARTSQVSKQPPVLPEIGSVVTPGAGSARGESMKTPTSRGTHASQANDYFSYPTSPEGERTPGSPLRTPRQRDTQVPFSIPNMKLMPPLPTPGGTGRPIIYKHASRSMIDILPRSPSPDEVVVPQPKAKVSPRPTTAAGKTRTGRRESRQKMRLDEERHTSPVLSKQQGEEKKPPAPPIPSYEVAAAAGLKRRRSMPTFSGASSEPPPYPSYPFPHPQHRPLPREDEGREPLPAYSNDIYLKAIMPRKMEFSKPGVQARDRKWRRVMCILEGTMFRVYDCPKEISGVGTLEDWWERKVGVGDIAVGQPGATANGTVTTAGAGNAASGPTAVSPVPGQGKLEDNGPGPQTARLTVPITTTPVPPAPASAPLQQGALPAATRSRLNLVNRLRSRSHGRSVSDVSNMAVPNGAPPRPSLNVGSSGNSSSDSETRTSPSSHLTPSSHSHLSSSVTTASNVSTRSSRRSSFLSGLRSGSQDPKAIPDPKPSDLIKVYTLQHAESGLGNDYFKRKNVIRVRMEGEQFLLQAKDISEVVEWIEGLQAAANIALDLDERPMPRGPLFPRRRRRRGARRNTEAGGGDQNANTNNNPPRSPPLA
ncbi:hypothetical protein EV122DRAFT_272180 [Schizophyllum commune]